MQVCGVPLGGPGVSAAPAAALPWQQLAHMVAASTAGKEGPVQLQMSGFVADLRAEMWGDLVVCSKNGAVDVLQLSTAAKRSGDKDEQPGLVCGQSVVLPGELFSSPVVLGPWVVLGCRDDHLYCLKVRS